MAKVHFTRRNYMGRGACQSDPNQNLEVTEDILKVTCKRCLSAITPIDVYITTTEEWIDRVRKHVLSRGES
jgi:hypothetical protein